MTHRTTVAAGLLALAALVAPAAAQATPPAQQTVTLPPMNVTNPDACGFGVTWHIEASARVQYFFDAQGTRTMALIHVKEHNTLENRTSGAMVSDEPNYEEMAHYDADGHLVRVDTLGLWVNARAGGDSVTAVGRYSIAYQADGTPVTVFAAGDQEFRQVTHDDLQQALTQFCGLLS